MLVQSRAGLVFFFPFRSWMMMMMRGTERCHGNFFGMGRMVKDPWNRPINRANSQQGKEKDNKKAPIFLSEELTSHISIIASSCTCTALHCRAESPQPTPLCRGCADPCLSLLATCRHRFMAAVLAHLPAVHLTVRVIKERLWSNSTPLLSQGMATGSHCWPPTAQGGLVAVTWH